MCRSNKLMTILTVSDADIMFHLTLQNHAFRLTGNCVLVEHIRFVPESIKYPLVAMELQRDNATH